jgi:glutamate dehydrogenase
MHTIVRIGGEERKKINVDQIERRIAATVVSWRDKLREQLIEKFGQDEGFALFREYGESFRPAYETDTTPKIACLDVKRIDGLLKGEHDDFLLLHRPEGTPDGTLHFRTFRKNEPLPLSGVLPILEDLAEKRRPVLDPGFCAAVRQRWGTRHRTGSRTIPGRIPPVAVRRIGKRHFQ